MPKPSGKKRWFDIYCYVNDHEETESFCEFKEGDKVELVVVDRKTDEEVITFGLDERGNAYFHRGK